MAKIISQDTYDDVIKENIIEFAMSPDEAREETIKQFEAQGVNLANIIKDLRLNEDTGTPILVECVEKIRTFANGTVSLTNDEFETVIQDIITECDKSVPHRVMASNIGGFEIIAGLCETHKTNPEKVNHLLLAISAIMNKQPDVFNSTILATIKSILTTTEDKLTIKHCLRCLQRACVMHEKNRQMIVDAGVVEHLAKTLLKADEPFVVKEACCLLRMLVLDDDVRVEISKAHDHAREIAGAALEDITMLLQKFKKEEELIGDLMLTIACLCVRNELCLVVENAGGLEFTMNVMAEHPDNKKMIREGLKLLKALAGNDKIKVDIVQRGGAQLITSLLALYKSNEPLAKLALGCIATVTLRVQDNGLAFFDSGAAEIIVETMKTHPKSKSVQRNSAWSIRNMVSRCRDKCILFTAAGVEDCLNDALKEHPSIQQDIKSALRDIGANVKLTEEWKGKAEKEITKNF